ncbi:MAG: tetratricopeptide repeat protein [Nitrospinae bacterium]|nr:tetratricopeptide repeat protein [Nitrospinota bacterium]
MARYNKIVRKKEEGAADIIGQPASLLDYLKENWEKAAIGLGGLAVAMAAVYGVWTYLGSQSMDAQARLYNAVKTVPLEGASMAQADKGITALKAMLEKGGSSQTLAQGRLELAALHMRKNDFQGALEAYRAAKGDAGKGSLIYELATAGEGNALELSGKPDEASARFKELVDNSSYYPKQDALLSMALSLASAGKKDEAVKAINRLKTEFPDYLTADFLNDTARRIESGAKAAPAAAPATGGM